MLNQGGQRDRIVGTDPGGGGRRVRVGQDHQHRVRRDVVSIVRVGLAETKGFDEGYDAIFGGGKTAAAGSAKKAKATKGKAKAKASAKPVGVKKKAAKKPAGKKKS